MFEVGENSVFSIPYSVFSTQHSMLLLRIQYIVLNTSMLSYIDRHIYIYIYVYHAFGFFSVCKGPKPLPLSLEIPLSPQACGSCWRGLVPALGQGLVSVAPLLHTCFPFCDEEGIRCPPRTQLLQSWRGSLPPLAALLYLGVLHCSHPFLPRGPRRHRVRMRPVAYLMNSV